jgi:hypothetical protein
MRRRLDWFVLAVVLVALVVGLSLFASSGAARATVPAAGGIDDMHHAEAMLRDARAVLGGAPGEYGGYRDKAIKKVDEAIVEVQNAIKHH